jgi:hypothetical protein
MESPGGRRYRRGGRRGKEKCGGGKRSAGGEGSGGGLGVLSLALFPRCFLPRSPCFLDAASRPLSLSCRSAGEGNGTERVTHPSVHQRDVELLVVGPGPVHSGRRSWPGGRPHPIPIFSPMNSINFFK